jgi:hypothetical protein
MKEIMVTPLELKNENADLLFLSSFLEPVKSANPTALTSLNTSEILLLPSRVNQQNVHVLPTVPH